MDDAGLKRLRMRSWRRGMRETDLLLGGFADEQLAQMNATMLADYEALLEENDQELYSWIVAAHAGVARAPARFQPLIDAIAAAAAARLPVQSGAI